MMVSLLAEAGICFPAFMIYILNTSSRFLQNFIDISLIVKVIILIG